MNESKHLYWFGGAFLVMLALFLLSRSPAEVVPAGGLQGIVLRTHDSKSQVDLGVCSTPKCLTVYVSPWCTICRQSTLFIKSLRGFLQANNIETRIIVGRGVLEEVEGYAPEFGPGTLVDAEGVFPLQGGVPNFIVSTPAGEILKVVPGVPQMFKPPFPDGLMAQMGQYLGLL